MYSSVAQLAAQQTVNLEVGGSSPPGRKYRSKKKNNLFLISSIFLLIGSTGRVVFHLIQLLSEEKKYEIYVNFISITFVILSLVNFVYFSLIFVKIKWVKYEDFAVEKTKWKLSGKQLKIIIFVCNFIVVAYTILTCALLTHYFKTNNKLDWSVTFSLNLGWILLTVAFVWSCLGLYYFKKLLNQLKDFDKLNKKIITLIKFIKSVIKICLYLFVLYFPLVILGIIYGHNDSYYLACTNYSVFYLMLCCIGGLAHALCITSKEIEKSNEDDKL
ncbi:hypothetical protein M0812_03046 [Anaeramoeba flamelloides]|uniref:DUF2975 domain-containing protein n=1 Tax=Anaeramoeba flamelloides TaxID=1746091 RepID=A0AAV7YRR8_9EUKA|nr:hypothetical protein M0812_03046 [Anaeramoeba flamelloides]